MKFLCIRCDEAMKLEQVEGPEDGSLSVVFACASCGYRVAMLANPWETQLVRALDVKIGGRASPAEPMAFVRSMLAPGRDAGRAAPRPGVTASGAATTSGCPFSAMANLAAERSPDPTATGQPGNRAMGYSDGSEQAPGTHPAIGEPGTSSCPVAGLPDGRIPWSAEAERRLQRIPEFIRPMVRQSIERHAAERGYRHITEAVMDEVRGSLGLESAPAGPPDRPD